jgi:hypothetical protein
MICPMSEVKIDPRFCGPAQSANGGYACGLLAVEIAGPAEVTLRAPPPLGRHLLSQTREDGTAVLLDGEAVVAEARPTTLEGTVPAPVTSDQALRASQRYEWIDEHPYPRCFVCGPQRDPGDGLRIFPGPVEGRELYACTWTPDESLGDALRRVRPEFVWAALDCPSGIVTNRFGEIGMLLLGRLAVELLEPVPVGEICVVTAWTVAREGRKLDTGSALFDVEGVLLASGRARWIELREQ